MCIRDRDEYEQLLFSDDFSHEEPAAEETAAADEADDAEDDICLLYTSRLFLLCVFMLFYKTA